MRAKHYPTIGMAVVVLALDGATLSGQVDHSASVAIGSSKEAHIHIGHVITMSPDTPNTQGFLPVAVADAKVAATHAGLMQQSPDNLESMKLHAGHVLHALDQLCWRRGLDPGTALSEQPETRFVTFSSQQRLQERRKTFRLMQSTCPPLSPM